MTSDVPRRLVIDASLALKWELNDEEFVDQAVAIRDEQSVVHRVQLLAPTLFPYEITNGISRAARRLRFDANLGSQMVKRIMLVGVILHEPDATDIYTTVTTFGITSAYDAAYVTLALQLGIELWTADRRLFDPVSSQIASVRWIGDWPTY